MMLNRRLKNLPNLFTVTNMLLGLTVLFILREENYRPIACALILLAACLDGIDGKVARLLDAESFLGKQLDSFADLVSFGLAPLVVLLSYDIVRAGGFVVYTCLYIYAMAATFRLARFNIGDYKKYFVGLPITASGLILTLLNLALHYSNFLEFDFAVTLIMLFVSLLAVLMVSKVKIHRIGA